MILNLSCIVEGHGEVSAVRILLQRIQQALDSALHLEISSIRLPRKKLVKSNELEKAVEFAANSVQPPRGVLILIDADDDCPAELGPELLARARKARSDVSIGVVLAKYEYEAWFLASLQSLAGKRGLPANPPVVADSESIRDAKGYLTRLMPRTRAYSPRHDQPALTDRFDMQMARKRSPSFDKCWREIERLFTEVSTHQRGIPDSDSSDSGST